MPDVLRELRKFELTELGDTDLRSSSVSSSLF